MSLPGIVLAAGASSRMGRPKALLPLGNRTFVEQVVDTLQEGGVEPLLVVTREELEPALRSLLPHATVLINPQPSGGMLSSILVGIQALPPASGFLLALVDQPQVSVDTVRRVIARFEADPSCIVVPSTGQRRGHPIAFPAACIDELRHASADEGAIAVVRRDPARLSYVTAEDESILADINTPRDLQTLEETLREGGN